MARPLSPFLRHLGEAKYRCRLVRAAIDRVEDTAIGLAGLTAGPDRLAKAISDAREQLALLEAKAAEWGGAPPAMRERSAGTRDEIGDWLRRD